MMLILGIVICSFCWAFTFHSFVRSLCTDVLRHGRIIVFHCVYCYVHKVVPNPFSIKNCRSVPAVITRREDPIGRGTVINPNLRQGWGWVCVQQLVADIDDFRDYSAQYPPIRVHLARNNI